MPISRNPPPGLNAPLGLTTPHPSGGPLSVSNAQPLPATTSGASTASSATFPPVPSAQLRTRTQTIEDALNFQDGGLDTAGKKLKYDRLSSSVFSFFRGTGRLFYTGMTQVDRHMPKPLCNGDAHPENFGVMPGDDGKLVFGLNDFDEAAPAPFTWDLHRALVGFALVAEQNSLSDKDKKTAMKSLVKRYVKTLKKHSDDDKESTKRITSDNAPKVVEHLLKSTKKDRSRKEFLKDVTKGGEIRESDDVKRAPHLKNAIQVALNGYAAARGEENGFYQVKDVAIKTGSGTASLGQERFWVLIDGKNDKEKNDVLLELKPQADSILTGLTPLSPLDAQLENTATSRAVQAAAIQLAGTQPFFGQANVEGKEFMVRERGPFKNRIVSASLDADALQSYGKACGMSLALAHARSDPDGGLHGASMEQQILDAIAQRGGKSDFVDEMVQRGLSGAQQTQDDHVSFKQLYAQGQL